MTADLVKRLGGPLDEVERVHALHRVRAVFGDDLGGPVGLIGCDVRDQRALRSGPSSSKNVRSLARSRPGAAHTRRPESSCFPVPAYDWLAGEGGAWAAARLSAGGPMTELFDPAAMVGELERARAADGRAAQRVWLWLVLQAWMERWL